MKKKTQNQEQEILDEFNGKFRISEEEKAQLRKEYEELNQALKYSEDLYDSIDYMQINIASPQKIRSWGFRNTPITPYRIAKKLSRSTKTKEEIDKEIQESLEKTRKEVEKKIKKRDLDFPFTRVYDVGEVATAQTLSFKTGFPIKYGLFCPSIFGPVVSWQCGCEKYRAKPKRFVFRYCEKCQIELTDSRVRRYRMAYYMLNIPIAHFWYFTGRPNYLKQIIDAKLIQLKTTENSFEKEIEVTNIGQEGCKVEELLNIIYCPDGMDGIYDHPLSDYVTIDAEEPTPNEQERITRLLKEIIKEGYFSSAEEGYEFARDTVYESTRKPNQAPRLRRGCEVLEAFLTDYNIKRQLIKLKSVLTSTIYPSKKDYQYPPEKYPKRFSAHRRVIGKIRILESFFATKTELKWMLLTILPILPAGLRIMHRNKDGSLLTSDINFFYSEIIKKNQTLGKIDKYSMYEIHILSKIFVPLQRSIDQLIDNARTDEPRKRKLHSVPFKSLTEGLETKEGRFRLNLFGKRVNYSARSVIVVGPYLRINQCAIPYKIAKTLFAPLLQRKVLELQRKNAIYHPIIAQNIIRLDPLKIYQILCILAEEYSVLLNRAPTLHKFGIQSFEPLITLTQAIELHPLVCTGFNADFDGDQMGLYLPFYKLSQFEILSFMKSSSNMFSPTNGEPVLKPTQDMVIGAHYLTSLIAESQDFSPEYFSNEDQVIMRFYQKKCSIHTRVLVNYPFQNERFAIEKDELFFFTDLLPFFKKKIVIQKIFYSQGNYTLSRLVKKVYIFTNVGIIIAKKFSNSTYEILNLLLETTPGRILFEKYIKAAIQKVQ